MNGRLRPTSTMSPRRSAVIVTDEPSGISINFVSGGGAGAWPCARAVAASANMAVPLSSARRPTTFGDRLGMGLLDGAMFRRFGPGRKTIRDARARSLVLLLLFRRPLLLFEPRAAQDVAHCVVAFLAGV